MTRIDDLRLRVSSSSRTRSPAPHDPRTQLARRATASSCHRLEDSRVPAARASRSTRRASAPSDVGADGEREHRRPRSRPSTTSARAVGEPPVTGASLRASRDELPARPRGPARARPPRPRRLTTSSGAPRSSSTSCVVSSARADGLPAPGVGARRRAQRAAGTSDAAGPGGPPRAPGPRRASHRRRGADAERHGAHRPDHTVAAARADREGLPRVDVGDQPGQQVAVPRGVPATPGASGSIRSIYARADAREPWERERRGRPAARSSGRAGGRSRRSAPRRSRWSARGSGAARPRGR